jgi:catechol 2,3-dioxygenase-like lactoylglutathione lyase family enzyme
MSSTDGRSSTSADYQAALYHVGMRVPNLESAMAELGDGLGLTWAEVVEREQPIWTPTGGAGVVSLRFTYSCEGPQHVELLQGAAGSIWDGDDRAGIHHLGIWVDDVAAETDRRLAAGWTLEMAQKSPEQGYGSMTYVRSPSGFLLEPVTVAARPRFERWWAGASLG